jgi:5-carboxymethyl-2-hydroxymuconate isomerase
MPHLTVEYSKNLDTQADISQLCHALHATLLRTGLFEIGAIRVRAVAANYYSIADNLPENAFADLTFRIGVGRSESEKKQTGEALMACAKKVLASPLASSHFALSLEIREIDPNLSWRENAMHSRLRNK